MTVHIQTPMMFKDSNAQDVIMVLKFLSNSPVTHVAANTHPSLSLPAVITCTQNLQFCLNKWNQVILSSARIFVVSCFRIFNSKCFIDSVRFGVI